jgi:hypothetical protein
LVNPGQQAVRADELHSLRPGGLDELLGELLLINPIRHDLDRLCHG